MSCYGGHGPLHAYEFLRNSGVCWWSAPWAWWEQVDKMDTPGQSGVLRGRYVKRPPGESASTHRGPGPIRGRGGGLGSGRGAELARVHRSPPGCVALHTPQTGFSRFLLQFGADSVQLRTGAALRIQLIGRLSRA